MKDNINEGRRVISKREAYSNLTKAVNELQHKIRFATPEDTRNALEELAALMNRFSSATQVSEIKGILMDIQGTIYGVLSYDTPRSSVTDLLDVLMAKIGNILIEEERKKKIAKVQALLRKLADNTEALVEAGIINLDDFS